MGIKFILLCIIYEWQLLYGKDPMDNVDDKTLAIG